MEKPQTLVHSVSHDLRCTKCHSFAQWCIDNQRNIYLDQWDYEKNERSPWETPVYYKKKIAFKCINNRDHCIMASPDSIVTNGSSTLLCATCRSIGTFIEQELGLGELERYWDYDKNKKSPYEVFAHSAQKVYIKCLENPKHGSYLIEAQGFTKGNRCNYCSKRYVVNEESLGAKYPSVIDIWSNRNLKTPFEYAAQSNKDAWWKCPIGKHEDYRRDISHSLRYNFRCPDCVEETTHSIIAEKTIQWIKDNNYEYVTDHKCPIVPVNPKTRAKLPFDVCIPSIKLIVEVHGEQHYSDRFYRSMLKMSETEAQKALRYRQILDRYKKIKAISEGYHYLELPYYSFDIKNQDKPFYYTKLLQSKVNAINLL